MIILIIFLFLFILYFSIAQEIYFKFNYLHYNLLFFAEKALIALQSDFKIENIGFVYPPLSFIPFLLLNDPLIVPSIISGALSTLLIIYLTKTYKPSTLSIISISILLVNPLYIFLATQKFDILLFYILLCFSVLYTIRYIETEYSLYIFISGLLFGIIFFVDFRILFSIPLYIISLFLLTIKNNINYRLAIILVKISPIIFFLLSWLYLNWIFTGNPLTFIQSPYSFFRSEPVSPELIQATGSFIKSFYLTVKQLFVNSFLILPYLLVIPYIKKYTTLYALPFFLIYIIPIFITFFSIYFGSFFPYTYSSILFLLFSLIFAFHLKIVNTKKYFLTTVISFISSFIFTINSVDFHEQNFVKFLINYEISEHINIKEDKFAAELLINQDCKSILTDDAYTFPVIYFTKNTNAFILPHNYIYNTALSNPVLFAECLLISKNPRDALKKRFPSTESGFIPGFYLLHNGLKYMIFVNINKNF